MDPAQFYRMAARFNQAPEDLEQFFAEPEALEVFANFYGMLKRDVRNLAVKIASRLILKIAKQIADTGYRSGQLKVVKGYRPGAEIELDQSLENYAGDPQSGVLDNLASYVRHKKTEAFAMMLDHSYSMKGLKIVLAAITAAAVAQHFKKDYAILAFSNRVTVLKGINERIGAEEVLERLFALELQGDTDIRLVLENGLRHLATFERKSGLLLTDGAWNQGGDPLAVAPLYDRLGVIGFPPAKQDKVRQLATRGKGAFVFVEDKTKIAEAIVKCLA